MKKSLFLITTALFLGAGLSPAQGIDGPKPLLLPADTDVATVKDTGKLAIAELMAAFAANDAASGSTSYIIMPLGRDLDQGYFTLQFENAFTQKAGVAGYKLYTRQDDVLAKVLKEVEFQQNYGDALNQASMQKLALIGAEVVVLPRIDLDRSTDGSTTLRASISVHNVSTGQKLWGDEVSKMIAAKLSTEDWINRAGIGLAVFGGLVLLLWIIRTLRLAARPR